MSKAAASRHWMEATAAKITELRERDLRFGRMLKPIRVHRMHDVHLVAELRERLAQAVDVHRVAARGGDPRTEFARP